MMPYMDRERERELVLVFCDNVYLKHINAYAGHAMSHKITETRRSGYCAASLGAHIKSRTAPAATTTQSAAHTQVLSKHNHHTTTQYAPRVCRTPGHDSDTSYHKQPATPCAAILNMQQATSAASSHCL